VDQLEEVTITAVRPRGLSRSTVIALAWVAVIVCAIMALRK